MAGIFPGSVSTHTPTALRAVDEIGTRQALRSYRVRAIGTVGVGVGAWVLGSVILVAANYPDNGFVSDVVVALMGLGLVPLIGGLLALVNSVRMAWVLHRHPWVSTPIQYSEVRIFGTPNGTPTLFFADTNVLTLMAFKWRWRRFQDLPEVWLAGSPAGGGVVSVPGGGYLVWAHRPRTPGLKRQLLKSRPKVSPSSAATRPDRSWLESSDLPAEGDPFPPLEQKGSFSDLASRLHTAVESPDRDDT